MGYPRTSDKVFEYLQSNKDQMVSVVEIMQATGLNKKQVQSSIQNLRFRQNINIESLVGGTQAIYHSQLLPSRQAEKPEKVEREIAEYLATTKDGRLLFQGISGKLYLAEEL